MERLGLETLPLVEDGVLKELFDAEVAKVFKDCDERPHVNTARTITLTIKITPDKQSKTSSVNELKESTIGFEVGSSLPKQSFSRKVKAVHRKSGSGFGFESDTENLEHDDSQKKLPGEK